MKLMMNLNGIEKVKKFVDINNTFDGDVIVHSGVFVVDGTSIMGIFSLNLINPVEVNLIGEQDEIDRIVERYKELG